MSEKIQYHCVYRMSVEVEVGATLMVAQPSRAAALLHPWEGRRVRK